MAEYNFGTDQHVNFIRKVQLLSEDLPLDLSGYDLRMDIRRRKNSPTVILSLAKNNGLFVQSSVLNALRCPGDEGDYAQINDSNTVHVTGDLELRCEIAPDSLTPTNQETFISKWSGNERSFSLGLNALGQLVYQWSTDGLTAPEVRSFVPLSSVISTGDIVHVKATHDVDNGSFESDITFYTSLDGVTWSQLGFVEQGSIGITSINPGAARIAIGSQNDGTQYQFSGLVYSASVRDGIDGQVVASYSSETAKVGSDSVYVSETNQVWELLGNTALEPTNYLSSENQGIVNIVMDADTVDLLDDENWYDLELVADDGTVTRPLQGKLFVLSERFNTYGSFES